MNRQETLDCLDREGIGYELTEHKAVYNMAELAEVDLPYPHLDAKNLFVRDDKRLNYYLITYRPAEGKYIHFRLDRISDLEVTEVPCPPLPAYFDLAQYARTVFDMHSGESCWVTLELDHSLLNVAMDRFGQDAHYRDGQDGSVIVSAQVEVSPTFLSWVLCFGGRAKILSPDSDQKALQALAEEALGRYS